MSGMLLSMPKLMPVPHAKEAPRFKGEYLKDFLDEFEILAKAAGISNAEHCDYLVHYCCCDKLGFDHKRFVKGLKEYLETDWKKLKACLAKCYPPEEEEFSVTKKALVKFIQQNRNIHNLTSTTGTSDYSQTCLKRKRNLRKMRGIPYLSMAYRTRCARK